MKRTLLAVGFAVLLSMMATPHRDSLLELLAGVRPMPLPTIFPDGFSGLGLEET